MDELVMQLSDPKPPYRSECLRCGETVFLTEQSVHLVRQRIQSLWKCESCDYAFETRVAFRLHRSARASAATAVLSAIIGVVGVMVTWVGRLFERERRRQFLGPRWRAAGSRQVCLGVGAVITACCLR